MLENIGNNAHKLELPSDMHVSATFNVGGLVPYVEDDIKDLRENPSQEGS